MWVTQSCLEKTKTSPGWISTRNLWNTTNLSKESLICTFRSQWKVYNLQKAMSKTLYNMITARFDQAETGLITVGPVESRNQWNRTCLTAWRNKFKTEEKQNLSGKSYRSIPKVPDSREAQLEPTSTYGPEGNLPQRGRPTNVSPRAHQQLIREVPELRLRLYRPDGHS